LGTLLLAAPIRLPQSATADCSENERPRSAGPQQFNSLLAAAWHEIRDSSLSVLREGYLPSDCYCPNCGARLEWFAGSALTEVSTTRIGCIAPTSLKRERAMSIRFSHVATGMLVVAVMALTSDRSWAIRYGLGPSKDDWKLKYDVAVHDADGDRLTVVFSLADEGRLKPIYSIDLVAFSKQTDNQGGRSYDVMVPIELKPTEDGKRVGEVQIRKEFLDRAKIRIITLTVDGKRQPSGGAFYDIPIAKYSSKSPAAAPPTAASRPARPSSAAPSSKVTK
jgi:hypothetical protein